MERNKKAIASYIWLKYRASCARSLSHWQVFRIVILGGVRFKQEIGL